MKGSAHPVHVKLKVYTFSVIVWGQSQLRFQDPCSRLMRETGKSWPCFHSHQSLPSVSTNGNSWNLPQKTHFQILAESRRGFRHFPTCILTALYPTHEQKGTFHLHSPSRCIHRLCQCWNLNELGLRPSAPEGLCGGAWGHLVNQGLLGTDL